MPQQINKKILLYFFLFIILGTFNNKNLNKFEFPKINRINISGFETQNNNFQEKLEILKLNNLFLLKKSQIEELFDTNNLIEEYKIFKKYPSSLEVEIIKTKFLALLNIDGKTFFVGSNGRLIETKNNLKDLPYIFGNLDMNNFLRLKKIIDNSTLEFKEIKNLYFFPSGRWDVELSSGILIKLPNEKLKESLDLSLNLLNNEKFVNVQLIDLRQKNQVIVNEQ
jgi:cell division protein FtsQ